MDAGLRLRDVAKTYPGGVEALRGLSLDAAKGELIAIVGPSGCGKSTLLRLVAGLEDLSRGEIHVAGRAVHRLPPGKRNVSMMFQDYALFPHMTVAENMAFGLKLRRVPRAEIDERVHRTATLLGLDGLLHRYPAALSGGQRQRTALGRAVLRSPDVFLLDEPLSNLDAELRAQMRVEIKSLHARLGATTLFVTHDQAEAMTLGDRIVVLREGEVQQVSDPITLYARPENTFVAGFIGSPGMGFLPARLEPRGEELHCRFGEAEFPVAPQPTPALRDFAGKPVILGVRPEDLRPVDSPPGAARRGGAEPAMAGFSGVVKANEPMGSHALLHLDCGGAPLAARIELREPPAPGSRLRLAFDPARAHFFDPVTRRRLG